MATRTRSSRARRTAESKAGREKVSVTIEREILDEIRQRADNLSEYINQTLSDDLYFARVQEEVDQLAAEGVEVDEESVRRLTEWMREVKRRIRARRAAQLGAAGT